MLSFISLGVLSGASITCKLKNDFYIFNSESDSKLDIDFVNIEG